MPSSARLVATLVVLTLLGSSPVRAQTVEDRPRTSEPKRPPTVEELRHREAVTLYGRAILAERQSRLLEAVRLHEQAIVLDPDAPAPHRALVSLYLALDRMEEALVACKRAVDLDPGDHDTWHLYARQLRAHQRLPEAAAALTRALSSPRLKDLPERRVQFAHDLGNVQESLKDFAAAEAAYRQVVEVLDQPGQLVDSGEFTREEIDTRAAETYERLGRVSVAAGKPESALGYYRKARDRIKATDPTRARRLAFHVAEVHMAREQWTEALAALNDYIDSQPLGTEAYRAKIKVLRKLGRTGEVLSSLQNHVTRDRHNTALRLLLAEELGAAGQWENARTLYQEIARVAPGPDVYRGLFKLYAQTQPPRSDDLLNLWNETLTAATSRDDGGEDDGEAATRARSMLTVLRENPALVKLLLPVAQQRLRNGQALGSQTSYYLGVLAVRARELDAAERLFREALQQRQSGGGRFNRNWNSDLYVNLLNVLRLGHKHEIIIQTCRQALNTTRFSADYFHAQIAMALASLDRLPEAITEADRAVDVSPDDQRYYRRLTRVRVLTQARQFEKAVQECLDLLEKYPKPADVRQTRHQLSTVYSAAHNYPLAEEQLRLLLQDDPGDAWAYNDLGYFWAEQGKNLEEAERLIRKALALDEKNRQSSVDDGGGGNAAYIDSLGWVLFRRGQFDAARRELERALALPEGAEDPVVWDHLGDVCYRQGDTARARSAWEKAIHLWEVERTRAKDDHYKETKEKLKRSG